MGMLLMLVALAAAVLVLGAGAAAVRWWPRGRVDGPPPLPPLPTAPPPAPEGIGGYWPVEAPAAEPGLHPRTLARVRAMLESGRDGDALLAVREDTGLGHDQARTLVELVRQGRIG
ncbi:hypothetical protein [Nocardiopsis ansamitocini]|uniref:Ribosomal protein L7/L12 C-terminal domain-containing protein n=1 Tax=Nocardiopsis ansamitocini TaxID=1670832 RepID=A0A9W6PB87_9ACTN|nr:hypothetical protein [Nocardiopsis ansamitocini]GLU50490.1 hypothetical protein Nans01_48410 [Nocardiopsis ansamitocini]